MKRSTISLFRTVGCHKKQNNLYISKKSLVSIEERERLTGQRKMRIPRTAAACVEDVLKLGLPQVEVVVIRPLLQKLQILI